MTIRRTILVAAVALIVARAIEPAAAAETRPAGFTLDDYAVTVARTSSSFQTAFGLDFGSSLGRSYWWFGGGRLSWVQGESWGDVTNAGAVGGVLGLGFRPDRAISPIARLGYDRWLGNDDTFRSQTCLSAGARFRVSSRLDPHYAISVEAYRAELSRADGAPDEDGFGILIGYSVAFYRKR